MIGGTYGKRKKWIAAGICAAMMFESLGTYGTLTSYAAEEQTQVVGADLSDADATADQIMTEVVEKAGPEKAGTDV